MNLSLATFVKATGLSQGTAKLWLPRYQLAIDKCELNTPKRLAGFIAQSLHETGNLKYLKELWGPTLAQHGYEGRRDLGNTHFGDGFKFRGRGIFQTTGRANYTQVANALNIDCVDHPELLELPEYAMKSAILYWNTRKRGGLSLNQLCDKGDFEGLTKAINGGTTGLEDRRLRYNLALKVLG